MTALSKPYMPQELSGLDVAFPTDVRRLMPAWEDIPEDIRRGRHPWAQLFSDWFFLGLSKLELKPKPGIDQDKALRHIKCVMRSWEPKHEHKEAAVTHLLSEWFDSAEWKPAERKVQS